MRKVAIFGGIIVFIGLLLTGCQEQVPTAQAPDLAPGQGQGNQGPPQPSADLVVPDDHSTIQGAVDAAQSGDVVMVKKGQYQEQVVINKDLTLRGQNRPTIKIPESPDQYTFPENSKQWEPILFAYGGSAMNGDVSGSATIDVTISGFTIDGQNEQPEAKRAVSILLRNVNHNGNVSDNVVRNMAVGGKETFGILVYGDSEVTIAGNRVLQYERGGIGANGDGGAHPAPKVVIKNNQVTGSTGIGEAWGPNGIQIGYGAAGQITDNTVRDNRYSESAPVASGILVFESDGVMVRDNKVSNSDAGIAAGSWGWLRPTTDNLKIMQNKIEEAIRGITLRAVAFGGYTMTDPSVSNTKVVNNTISSGMTDDNIGIAVRAIDASSEYDPKAENNKVINNSISGFASEVEDAGTATKVHANVKPFE